MAANVRQMIIAVEVVVGSECRFSQWPWFSIKAIEIKRNASPSRFIRAVIMPAPRAVGV